MQKMLFPGGRSPNDYSSIYWAENLHRLTSASGFSVTDTWTTVPNYFNN